MGFNNTKITLMELMMIILLIAVIGEGIILIRNEKPNEFSQRNKLMKEIQCWATNTFNNGVKDMGQSIPIARHLETETWELIEILTIYRDHFNNITFEHEEEKRVKQKIREDVKMELADCYILLDNISKLMEFRAQEIHRAQWDKMRINKKRKWGFPDKNGVVEHYRDV